MYTFLVFLLVRLLPSLSLELCSGEDAPPILALYDVFRAIPALECCRSTHFSCDFENSRVVALRISFQDEKLQILPEQVCDLKKLRSLQLKDSKPSEVPTCLYDLPELEDVDITRFKNMSSSIVHQLTTHARMKKLRLVSVDLATASFNSILSRLQNLEELSIIGNDLSTIIPPTICSLNKLVYINLASNNLQGEIPACFSNLSRIESLWLPDNNLQGSIQHLKTLSRLSNLRLSRNQLDGPFPHFVCNTTVTFTELVLSENHFKSQVPDCISFIPIVSLYKNQFYGPLPSSLFSTNSSITIDLSYNTFTGPLPRITGTSQTVVSLSNNFLTGSLASHDWNLLPTLASLDLSNNMLAGPIPAALSNCTRLNRLELGNNQLTGTLPASFGTLKSLAQLGVSSNRLQGKIPSTFGNISFMATLDLSNNNFVGELGVWIYDLQNVNILNVHSNRLSGHIPAKIGNFSTRLMALDLSDNCFQGRVPELTFPYIELSLALKLLEWGLVPYLHLLLDRNVSLYNNYMFEQAYLDLSGNMLQGAIPASIGNFTRIAYIDLSRNQLSGSIPTTIGNLYRLQVLDLSQNNLSGTIPHELGKLYQLSHFNVSGNNLSGPIPQGGQLSTFTREAYSGNPSLCDFPLSACDKSKVTNNTNATPTLTKEQHKGKKVIVLVAVLVSAATSALVILGVLRCHPLKAKTARHQAGSMSIFEGELWHATKGYNKNNVIGEGGCSTIYKGYMSDGRTVAVKVYTTKEDEFINEFDVLTNIRHRNIVRLLDCSFEPQFKALVLEYMDNGSLYKQLHELEGRRLPWKTRFNIALGIANALWYLHDEATNCGSIVHRDVKPSNIFLDKQMEAHLGDFGISKRLSFQDTSIDSKLNGSIGYVAPEYAFSGIMTSAGDVYSYGVVLLEILTRIQPTSDILKGESLRSWVHLHLLENRSEETLDPVLRKEAETSETVRAGIKNVLRIALLCTQTNAGVRPRMRDVAALFRNPNPMV